ncbi:MAG: DUF1127 domain-containing protein [Alphaproteobacteria bacterium]
MSTHYTQDQMNQILRAARAERAGLLADLIGAIPAAIGRMFGRFVVRADRSAAIRELRMLDDVMLKDIGLYRSEIWQVADAKARGVDVRQSAVKPVPAPVRRPAPGDTAPPANDNRDLVEPALAVAGRA